MSPVAGEVPPPPFPVDVDPLLEAADSAPPPEAAKPRKNKPRRKQPPPDGLEPPAPKPKTKRKTKAEKEAERNAAESAITTIVLPMLIVACKMMKREAPDSDELLEMTTMIAGPMVAVADKYGWLGSARTGPEFQLLIGLGMVGYALSKQPKVEDDGEKSRS